MFLLDTSAWITAFRGPISPGEKDFLQATIVTGDAATCPAVILELTQGCRTETERNQLGEEMASLKFMEIDDGIWRLAYDLGFSLRRKGLTVPAIDLLVAATALAHGCAVVHNDKHFVQIAAHSTLQTRRVGNR